MACHLQIRFILDTLAVQRKQFFHHSWTLLTNGQVYPSPIMHPLCRVEGAVSSLRRTVILDTESDAGLFDKISISNQMHWSVLDDAIAELSPDESARASRLTIFLWNFYNTGSLTREERTCPTHQDKTKTTWTNWPLKIMATGPNGRSLVEQLCGRDR